MRIILQNPNDEEHYAQVRTAKQHIQVHFNGSCIADTLRPLILTEKGRSMYDSVYYVPKSDILVNIARLPLPATYCPIKGHASYYGNDIDKPLAWAYDEPLPQATILKGLYAFDLNLVDLYLLSS